MMNNKDLFDMLEDLPEPVKIECAKDGESMLASKGGTVSARSVVEGEAITFRVGEVVFVPNLKFNLLSLRKLVKNGINVDFQAEKAVIMQGDRIVGNAEVRGNLYYFRMWKLRKDAALVTKNETETQTVLWHQRYGHLGLKNLEKLMKSEMVVGLEKLKKCEKIFCEPCAESKLVRLPFNGS